MILGDVHNVKVPQTPGIIMLEQRYFDPVMGEGEWVYRQIVEDPKMPNGVRAILVESEDWTRFEMHCYKVMPFDREYINHCLTLMCNFQYIIVYIKTRDIDTYMNGVLSGRKSWWTSKQVAEKIKERLS